jgi:hypothetical protein
VEGCKGNLWDRHETEGGTRGKVDMSEHMPEHQFDQIRKHMPFLWENNRKKMTTNGGNSQTRFSSPTLSQAQLTVRHSRVVLRQQIRVHPCVIRPKTRHKTSNNIDEMSKQVLVNHKEGVIVSICNSCITLENTEASSQSQVSHRLAKTHIFCCLALLPVHYHAHYS